MPTRKEIYDSLRVKMEYAGFEFEAEQKPFFQNRKEVEFKFTHSGLIEKLEEDGYKVAARKFYLKPLTDEPDCEIGLVTGKSSPLYKNKRFIHPNSLDSFDSALAWVNQDQNPVLDRLLISIKEYVSKSSKAAGNNLDTFLLTWNPNKWAWTDLKECTKQLEAVGNLNRRWSCGNSKSIQQGDRVFLMRVGVEPRGIIGSGYAKSSYFVAPHWDGVEGKTAKYIDIEFDVLIDSEKSVLLDLDTLRNIDQKGLQQWFPQQSGISIRPDIVDGLESAWFNLIREHSFVLNDVDTEMHEKYKEGRARQVIQTSYERSPEARKRCLSYYGFSCRICWFNFEQYFGETGRGYIHVHHINPISEVGKEYNVDPINDLIPVCPNCHAMIHAKRPAFTIEEIKQIRESAFK